MRAFKGSLSPKSGSNNAFINIFIFVVVVSSRRS